MTKQAVFTMKIEPELRSEFMAATNAIHRPASQVMRELMREFIKKQKDMQEYNQFLQAKVDAGRASMQAGKGRSNDDVEAKFSALRNQLKSKS
ncbi:CopG family ribbon-helix-helix protein [Serratia sp. DD3]|uniref:CopG family ribbon-helix-helix protein n=1 Tax=Serratia sp. DD3 TaxID=1410619 RepID=UPI0003C50E5F|nr:hypothetical protein [Serratia sp. DD3]KEY57016.1 hypothetical protein SRDD_40350 [Serratia sp. DD3]